MGIFDMFSKDNKNNNEKGNKSMVQLGQEVRDKVTGFTGIAIIEVDHLYGCTQFGVVPKMNENGEIKDAEFFDEGRLEFISQAVDSTGGIPAFNQHVQLGNEVRDKVTGFKGVAVARARYLFGGIRYGVLPKVGEDGKLKSSDFFDSGRIEKVEDGIKPKDVQGRTNGGSTRDLPRGVR